MFDARASAAMAAPDAIAPDSASVEHRCDELGHASIAAIGQDTSVCLAQRLDDRPSVVHRIVAMAWTSCRGGDDMQVTTAHQDLCVARPPVVLRASSAFVVARRDQGAVDDPRPAVIVVGLVAELGESTRHGGDDAMGGRFRDLKHGRELAHREVRTQRRTGDQDAMAKRDDHGRPRVALLRTCRITKESRRSLIEARTRMHWIVIVRSVA